MDNRVKIENKDIEILVAEDIRTQAEYLKRILEKYKVTVTHNGEEALASIEK